MPPKYSAARESKRGREDDSSPATAEDVVNLREELMCGICHELVVNATQTPCCGGLWCRGCIEQVKHKQCPTCRKTFTNCKLVVDARSERLSASLKRPCKHEARGCTFRGSRSDVKDHEPNCPHLTVAEVRKEMQSEIDAVTKEVSSLRRQLSSAQDANSKLKSINGRLEGVLNCDHVFSFRLQRGQSHTEKCSLFSCCWFTIGVQVKCNDDNVVSLALHSPRLPEKDVPEWSYINGRTVTFRYVIERSPIDIKDAFITPPKDEKWPDGIGLGSNAWLENYTIGSLVTVGISMR